jgi:hypothetical protein
MAIVEESSVGHEVKHEVKHEDGVQLSKTSNRNDGGSPPISKGTQYDNQDELTRLRALATDIREQDDLERNVGLQVYHT